MIASSRGPAKYDNSVIVLAQVVLYFKIDLKVLGSNPVGLFDLPNETEGHLNVELRIPGTAIAFAKSIYC